MYLDNFTCTYFFTHFKNEKEGYEIKEDLNVANQLFIEKIKEGINNAGHIDEYLLYNNQYKTI